MLPGAGGAGAAKLLPNWNGPPDEVLGAGAVETEPPN